MNGSVELVVKAELVTGIDRLDHDPAILGRRTQRSCLAALAVQGPGFARRGVISQGRQDRRRSGW